MKRPRTSDHVANYFDEEYFSPPSGTEEPKDSVAPQGLLSQMRDLRNQVSRQQMEIESMKFEKEEIEKENENLKTYRKEASQSRGIIVALKKQKDALQAKVDRMEATLSSHCDLQDQKADLEKRIDDLMAERLDWEKNSSRLSAENFRLENRIDDIENKTTLLQTECLRLEEEVTRCNTEKETMANELCDLRALNADATDLEKEYQKLIMERNVNALELAGLKAQVENMANALKTKEKEIENLEAKEKEFAHVKRDNEELKQEVERLQNEKQKTDEDVVFGQIERGRMNVALANHKEKIQELNDEIGGLNESLHKSTEEINGLKDLLHKITEENAHLKDLVDTLRNKEDATERMKELVEISDKSSAEIEQLKNLVDTLRTRAEEKKNDEELERLMEKIKVMTEEGIDNKNSLENTQKERQVLLCEKERLKKMISERDAENNDLKSQLNGVNIRLQKVTDQRDNHYAEVTDLRNKLQDVEDALKTEQTAKERVDGEYIATQEQVTAIKADLKRLLSEWCGQANAIAECQALQAAQEVRVKTINDLHVRNRKLLHELRKFDPKFVEGGKCQPDATIVNTQKPPEPWSPEVFLNSGMLSTLDGEVALNEYLHGAFLFNEDNMLERV